jgi:DNA-damage-inducible protein J
MPAEAVIQTRIDEALKQKAEAIYAAAGLTIDQMVKRMLQRTVDDQTVPYGLFGPNAETREAMEELQSGNGKAFSSVADLMADLNEDD